MCPPGTDQTTRGPQYWTIMVPALQEQYDLDSDVRGRRSGYPIQSLFVSDFTWDAFDKLFKQEKAPPWAPPLFREFSCPPARTAPSTLESLPAELLSTVLSDNSLSLDDLIAVGLTSQTMWTHVLNRISCLSRKSTWAGTPLICTGTYLKSVPQAVHTLEPDMKQQEEEFIARPGRGPPGAPSRGMCPARRWNWAARSKFADRSKVSLKDTILQSFAKVSERSNICPIDIRVLQGDIEFALSRQPKPHLRTKQSDARIIPCGYGFSRPPPPRWLLRNLTTNQYVTLKQRKQYLHKGSYFHVDGIPSLSVDKALLMKISWSREVDSAMKGKPCEWAGHCFDIVDIGSEPLNEQWSDATADIAAEWRKWKDSAGKVWEWNTDHIL